MSKIEEQPILKLACAVALAALAQLAYAQDHVAEHDGWETQP